MKKTPLDSAVTVARALGHPARLRVVSMLRSGELCVCQITEVLQLASSTVSAHLKELRLAGLIRERKEGKWVSIRLAEDTFARAWIETALAAFDEDPQIKSDDRLVHELRILPVEDLCSLGLDGARERATAGP
jgi:DNA-binding transcriptional ArsR family regulator